MSVSNWSGMVWQAPKPLFVDILIDGLGKTPARVAISANACVSSQEHSTYVATSVGLIWSICSTNLWNVHYTWMTCSSCNEFTLTWAVFLIYTSYRLCNNKSKSSSLHWLQQYTLYIYSVSIKKFENKYHLNFSPPQWYVSLRDTTEDATWLHGRNFW